MSYLGQQHDSVLIEKHNSLLTEQGEKERIKRELKRRGYIKHDGKWYREEEHDTRFENLGGFISIGIILFIVLYPILAPILLGQQLLELFEFLSEIALTVPENHPPSFSIETITDKMILVGGLFLIGSGFAVTPLFMQLLTKNKFKAVFLGLPISIVLGSSSTLFAYYESKVRNDITMLDLTLFAVIYLLSLIVALKAKSFLRRGIYLTVITIIGFILAGYGLITPYILLLLCGYSMLFIIKK